MGTGGSRYGAGRPAWHVKAEHCRRIVAARWAKEGMFNIGSMGAWTWRNPDTGQETARIGYRGAGGAVVLDFNVNGEPVHQRIQETRTACNYGGSRSWFTCPRCWRRVGVLFLRGQAGFMCRHCGRIAYGSQSEDSMGRARRKQRKAEQRLGENWERPKGMHAATYDKLLNIITECEERRDDALAIFVARHFPHGLLR